MLFYIGFAIYPIYYSIRFNEYKVLWVLLPVFIMYSLMFIWKVIETKLEAVIFGMIFSISYFFLYDKLKNK